MAELLTRSSGRLRCIFVTVLWGDWHRNMFLDANLPTMLARGNLPALFAGVDCEYLLYTTEQDAALMMQNAAFRRLNSLMTVSLKLFQPSKTAHPVVLQMEIWREATAHARSRASFVLFMPPDVAWADGSFAALRAALEAGKRAIFMSYPRVVSETIVPALADRFPRNGDEAATAPAKDMMALAVAHIHPLMTAHSRSSTHFAIHPEMVLWPIEGDGFLLRHLARELFCFEPGRYPLNTNALLARMPPDDEIHVFADSREFLGISFTPLWKDMEWYLRRSPLDPLFVGRWWVTYDSPINDYISAIDFHFTCGQADEDPWRRAAQQARNLLAYLRSAREFLRILMTLQKMGHLRAAQFLAAALRVQGLARRWPHRGPFIVFAPTDEAFERVGFERVPGDGTSAADVRKMIESHVAIMPRQGAIKEGQVFRTLSGRDFQLENAGRAELCGDNTVLPIRDVLSGVDHELNEQN
jgi:hypothetical protein